MAEGIVLWFDDNQGIGFIESQSGKQFFVHHSAIEMEGFRTLCQGDIVDFTAARSSRGPEARNVKKKA